MEALAGVAGARRVVYRTLAALLLPPAEERVRTLVLAAPELRRLTEPLDGLEPYPAWLALLDSVEGLGPEDFERSSAEYTTLFLSGSPDRSVSPYESAHVRTPEFGQAMLTAEVETRYRSAGVVLADVVGGELPDHIAVELEFLAFLCQREAEAEPDQVGRWRVEQLSFLRAHLLRWLGPFEARLREVAQGSLATECVGVARAFAEHDILLLEALGSGLTG